MQNEMISNFIKQLTDNQMILNFVILLVIIIIYHVILFVIKLIIVKYATEKATWDYYLDLLKRFVNAAVYIPAVVYGVINYIGGIEVMGITNEFALSTVGLIIFDFIDRLINLIE